MRSARFVSHIAGSNLRPLAPRHRARQRAPTERIRRKIRFFPERRRNGDAADRSTKFRDEGAPSGPGGGLRAPRSDRSVCTRSGGPGKGSAPAETFRAPASPARGRPKPAIEVGLRLEDRGRRDVPTNSKIAAGALSRRTRTDRVTYGRSQGARGVGSGAREARARAADVLGGPAPGPPPPPSRSAAWRGSRGACP